MAASFVILECIVVLSAALLTPELAPSHWMDVAGRVGQALVAMLCWVLTFYYRNLYDLRKVGNLREFAKRLPASLIMICTLMVAVYLIFPSIGLTQDPLPQRLLSLLPAVMLILLVRGIFYALTNASFLTKRVLILGTGTLAQAIANEIEAAPHRRYTVMGFVEDSKGSASVSSFSSPHLILGPLRLLEKIIETGRPHCIVVALAERRQRLPVQALLQSCVQGIEVEDGIDVHEHLTQKLAINNMVPSSLIFSKEFKKPKHVSYLRRMISLSIAAVGLLLAAPLMILLAIIVKLDSEGPVFFVQDRAGLGGRSFRLLKFRTMHPLASDIPEPVWSRDVASRLTRAGKWLRRLYLDELPQLVNILRGDMDVVGPRPEMSSNIGTMQAQIPYYAIRNAVRPGLTGWAQIKQGYAVSREDVMEKMRYDLYYIKHMSLWFDLMILLATVKIVLSRRGT
jgi:exopolysaccharide biosynthesis polyprenyl glycosylphosphotransferase